MTGVTFGLVGAPSGPLLWRLFLRTVRWNSGSKNDRFGTAELPSTVHLLPSFQRSWSTTRDFGVSWAGVVSSNRKKRCHLSQCVLKSSRLNRLAKGRWKEGKRSTRGILPHVQANQLKFQNEKRVVRRRPCFLSQGAPKCYPFQQPLQVEAQ